MKLKALSFRQPWAALILEGRKTLDLRTWSTHYRGPLAIYASLEVEKEACQVHGVDIAQLTTGALIGIVDLVDVIPLDEAAYNARQAEHLGGRRFRPGLYGWKLTNPRPLDPPQVVKGELAESFSVEENPLRIEINLRKGIFWQEKKGVMKSREFVADDVIDFFNRAKSSKKAIPTQFTFIDRWEAQGKYKVVFFLNEYNANWQFRLGWGFYNAINPPEVAKAGSQDWKNVTGTGPYMLEDYRRANYVEFVKNPHYWDSTLIDGKSYQIPFTDGIRYLLNKDEQSRLAALRTGKVDLAAAISWQFVDEVKKQAPDLKWAKWLWPEPLLFSMRMDTKPFDDIRVRRAMALAINQPEILKTYFQGDAVLFSYPFPLTWKDYYDPLEKQSPAIQELFSYNPEKARQLLAEAGYPNGFTVKAQVLSTPGPGLEQAQMVVAYLAKIGVTLELEPMAYGNYLSVMLQKKHGPAYFFGNGHTNPIIMLRKNFTPYPWNAHMFSDPAFDKKMAEMMKTLDETKRIRMIKELGAYANEQVPYVQLPNPYAFSAWWPWVKNYHGEQYNGAYRYGPIHARIWIDQKLKDQMGK
ncbi:ASCH domain-containing protein [bacterium]|nr:ASCH domain-containing protein [bacterium]